MLPVINARLPIYGRAAPLADTRLRTISKSLNPYPCRLVTLRAHQHHIGNLNGSLSLNDAELCAHISCAALMFLDKIEACNDNAHRACVAAGPVTSLLTMMYTLDFTPCAYIIASNHFNSITFAYFHRATSHQTSGARETIFINPCSRNSRATGPKMRVPRGFLNSSIMTTALSSNLM